jgi:hypothetical protein
MPDSPVWRKTMLEVGDSGELAKVITEERRYRMKTQCFNQRLEMVLDGEAVVAVPKPGNEKSAGDRRQKRMTSKGVSNKPGGKLPLLSPR